ncbi:hypothetical protein KDI_10340 [Dictyobacter arantiisoli]|uniref:Uncharacterized protein n=2 Tax=Dictyobacter arantiisoli TaxID=2014874 RepID=A0A5A5T7M2_9CHLR|nr:hypothetical protein KDI_10340 [Dictyobacter arantiisoli]
MDGSRKIQEGSGPYIWLRYATQYTIRDGRTQTLEMSVPVPIGASVEERAALIREAEVGMQQLAAHMDQRVPSGTSQTQQSGSKNGRSSAPQPAVNTRTTPAQATAIQRGNRSAALAAPQTATQPAAPTGDVQEEASAGQSIDNYHNVPANTSQTQARHGSGLNLPSSEPGSNIPLPQFIQYIKDNLDLTPKQAMEMLNVRSLTTGINLRDALELLKEKVGQVGPAPASLQVPKRSNGEDAMSGEELPRRQPTSALPHIVRPEPDSPIIEMRVRRPSVGFDEEIADEELGRPADDVTSFDELDDLPMLGDEFSEQELERARNKVNSLRESQGPTIVSPQRLQVLGNVVLSQISEQELNKLISGVWNIQTPKKLKVDQAEALISWAKLEDDFMKQVEAVLEVL